MRKMFRKACVAVAGLALSLGSANAQEATKMLQADAELIMNVRVQQLLEAPLVKKHALEQVKAMLESNAEAKQAMAAMGLDPMKDLKQMTIGLTMTNPQQPDVTMVIEGNFDPTKIVAAAKNDPKTKEKMKFSELDGKTLFEIAGEAGSPPMFGSVVNDKMIVIGSKKDFVGNAIATLAGKGPGGPKNKELAELASKTNSKSILSAVGYVKGKLKDVEIPNVDETMKKLIEKVEVVVVEFGAEKDVNLSISLATDSAESAKTLTQTLSPLLDQAKGLAPLMIAQAGPQFKDLAQIINSLKVEESGKSSTLSLVAKEELIEKMIPKK